MKTLRSQKLRMLLTHRKLLQSKAIAIDNDLRGTLRNFGLKVGMVGTVKFEARIKELVENLPDLSRSGRTAAHGPAFASRTDRHPAPPFAGHRAPAGKNWFQASCGSCYVGASDRFERRPVQALSSSSACAA